MTIRLNRPNLLERIQSVLGDDGISSEMRSFFELCEVENLQKFAEMSKDELLFFSGNCQKAIGECK